MEAIPQEVIKAAEGEAFLGGSLQLLCKYEGEEVYSYVYDEPVTIGMPEFYLWNGKRVRIVVGGEGEELLAKLPI